MSYQIGKGYFGSPDIETTTAANQEILQKYLPTVSYGGRTVYAGAYKLSFKPQADCHIKINGGANIFMEANTTFNTDYYDLPITSIQIVENAIPYILAGAWR